MSLGSRVYMVSTVIKEIKRGVNGEAIIKGDCRVNNVSGYSFTSIMKDAGSPGFGKDQFSIEISGPDNFKFSAFDKTIAGGDIGIIWK